VALKPVNQGEAGAMNEDGGIKEEVDEDRLSDNSDTAAAQKIVIK
jgi:hypothetical protein